MDTNATAVYGHPCTSSDQRRLFVVVAWAEQRQGGPEEKSMRAKRGKDG